MLKDGKYSLTEKNVMLKKVKDRAQKCKSLEPPYKSIADKTHECLLSISGFRMWPARQFWSARDIKYFHIFAELMK